MSSTPPRSIPGSVGSRLRVILGATGKNWLLLADCDNGDRVWQEKRWSAGIPAAVAKQINNCTSKDRNVKHVDFNTVGSWYIHGVKIDGSGEHSWWGGTTASAELKKMAGEAHESKVSFGSDRYGSETYCLVQGNNGFATSINLNSALKDRMKEINTQRKKIHDVRLFEDGEYFISDDNGSQWNIDGDHLSKELKKGGKVEDVAKAGDGSWVVIRPNSFVSSQGVDTTLTQALNGFFREQRNRNSNRARAIQDYHRRIREEREAKEQAEREAREAVERAAREFAEQEAREAAERAAREAAEAIEAADRARREAEASAIEETASKRAASLESRLEERLVDESKSLQELEQYLENRKRSLQESIKELPPAKRKRFETTSTDDETARSKSECVVCQDQTAVRAIVPCGHLCLCDNCSGSLSSCPLCRGLVQSTLKIFGQTEA